MNKAKKIRKLKENIAGYCLILPLLISLTIFTIYPLAMALFDSFFYDYIPRSNFFDRDWTLFGFGNYIKAFKTGDFQHSMALTLIYAVVMIPSTLSISFNISCSKFRFIEILYRNLQGLSRRTRRLTTRAHHDIIKKITA
jgi:multiple sugar transport system permease protein